MKNKTLIFDLDGTLYYVKNQMERLCYNKVITYLKKNMNIDEAEAIKLIKNEIQKILEPSF